MTFLKPLDNNLNNVVGYKSREQKTQKIEVIMDFIYDGQKYQTAVDAQTIYNMNYFIQLPDRRYLKIDTWLESFPPVPKIMDEVDSNEIDALDLVAVAKLISLL